MLGLIQGALMAVVSTVTWVLTFLFHLLRGPVVQFFLLLVAILYGMFSLMDPSGEPSDGPF